MIKYICDAWVLFCFCVHVCVLQCAKRSKTKQTNTEITLDFHERPSEMIQIRYEIKKKSWKKTVANHFVLLPRQQGMTIFIYLQGDAPYIGWALFLSLRGIYYQYDCPRDMLSIFYFVIMHMLYWMWYFMLLPNQLGEEVY